MVYIRGMACPFRRLPVSIVAVALFSGLAHGQAFYLTGLGPDGGSSRVTGLSADGTLAAGYWTGSSVAPGFTWSAGLRNDFGLEPGLPIFTPTAGMSGNGQVVVGAGRNFTTNFVAYRWSGPGTYESLGVPSGYDRSWAVATSNDGSVIAGRAEFGVTGNIGQAFRWTEGGGYQLLGVTRPGQHGFSQSMGVSRDGSTVVGISRGADTQAFIWTTALGMQELPALPGTGARSTSAFGVNHDGTVVVGQSGFLSTPTVWRSGVPTDLGTIPDHGGGRMYAANDAGNVLVGSLNSLNGFSASIYTESRGLELLSSYLLFHGITVPAGINLRECTSVSASGNVIAGYTSGSTSQGFVVVIPTPASAGLFAVYILSIARRRPR
ncbi:MAG: hypothetical protein HBSAPP03_05340 [Phycisphaerae bacterium]|nr:MAG: hypothetical protein HBSAPP03_05340 [Phycisphaerae bacterium]